MLTNSVFNYSYSLFIILTVVAHRLGRTCIHKVGQYYVKPGQIQAMGTVEEEKEEPLKGVEGGERSENDEEGLEEEPTKTAAKEG